MSNRIPNDGKLRILRSLDGFSILAWCKDDAGTRNWCDTYIRRLRNSEDTLPIYIRANAAAFHDMLTTAYRPFIVDPYLMDLFEGEGRSVPVGYTLLLRNLEDLAFGRDPTYVITRASYDVLSLQNLNSVLGKLGRQELPIQLFYERYAGIEERTLRATRGEYNSVLRRVMQHFTDELPEPVTGWVLDGVGGRPAFNFMTKFPWVAPFDRDVKFIAYLHNTFIDLVEESQLFHGNDRAIPTDEDIVQLVNRHHDNLLDLFVDIIALCRRFNYFWKSIDTDDLESQDEEF